MPNRLATETSPYLRQHADNPVDWHPWGAEAFREAKASDRPILLSIGYAACHWCHVMAHESFEDPATAAVMNRLFVNVKVDREERPDVDGIYMQAVQAMTGRGGWPMTVFLTPEGEPFYGGTYFPPTDTHGMPSFTRLMEGVANAWSTKRDAVHATAATLRDLYANASAALTPSGSTTRELLHDAARGILRLHDPVAHGFGSAPKFPQAMALDFLLRHGTRHADGTALSVVMESWLAMANGGIFDQLGGGFARYSTDRTWVVPHFEKMLYDNALLARLGVHLVQQTGSAEVERTTRAVLDWARREMTGDEGALYSSIDADSEGEEGLFYTWTRDELRTILGDDAPLAELAFGVTAGGNFEGRSILVHAMPESFVAAKLELAPADVATRLASVRERLLGVRATRVRPATDRKRVAAWNGLMLCALADAARVFDDAELLAAAQRLAHVLTTTMCIGDRIGRSWIEDGRVTPGFLEDQAAVAAGMLALYTATGSIDALQHARTLAAAMVRDFHDDAAGSFFDTARDHEALITRPRELTDNATPSGASLACDVLLQLAVLDDVAEYRDIVAHHLDAVAAMMVEHPLGFGHWLGVADRWVHGSVEVALSGGAGADALLDAVRRTYVPTLVLARGAADAGAPALLHGRTPVDGRATAWVCRGYTCELPATDAGTFAQQLRAAVRFTNS